MRPSATTGPVARDFVRIARALAEPIELRQTLRRIVELAAVSIDAADHVGLCLVVNRQVGSSMWTDPVARTLEELHETTAEGPCLEALTGSKLIESGDLASETRWPTFSRQALERTDVRSVMSVRLSAEGHVLGALNVYATTAHAFTDMDRSAAAIFAVHAGIAVHAKQSEAELLQAIEGRDLIGQAKGILMAQQHIDEQTAFEALQAASQRTSHKLRHVAERVVASTEQRSVVAGLGGERPSGIQRARPGVGDELERQTNHGLTDLRAQEIVTGAVRGLFTCEQAGEVVALLLRTVQRLGGRIVRADESHDMSIPVDVALGSSEPLLATPDPHTPRAARHLHAHLPRLVEDARQAIARLERTDRLVADAELDPLTGLHNRRAYDRLAGRLGPGDVLVLLDLDDFKALNDTRGHAAGDRVLQAFGAVLRDEVRVSEHAMRFGGDEFLVVLRDAGLVGSDLFLERLHTAWEQRRPFPVGVSAGVAAVSDNVDAALETADRALYEEKRRRGLARRGSNGAA